MFVQESVLFKDLGPEFMGEISEAAQEETHAQDQVLFQRGDPADNLYLLEEGRISLFIEEGGVLIFSVDAPGEVFGWSALVEPNVYTASARCDAATRVLKIDRTALEHIFEKNPREAFLVMKRLAGAIGQRLARSYEAHLRSRTDLRTPSYG
ncbi:MAG: cyclic nucleotide-binding domain-containing protein [Proteobacteria bacterium]|nr:cyclic nucleotide-binding domain-containing protein [Pseudomonadota bacterium]MBU1742433.1 cyclic nucleotide-binding domain-containing protein [Pseudomonadota bacterium]